MDILGFVVAGLTAIFGVGMLLASKQRGPLAGLPDVMDKMNEAMMGEKRLFAPPSAFVGVAGGVLIAMSLAIVAIVLFA